MCINQDFWINGKRHTITELSYFQGILEIEIISHHDVSKLKKWLEHFTGSAWDRFYSNVLFSTFHVREVKVNAIPCNIVSYTDTIQPIGSEVHIDHFRNQIALKEECFTLTKLSVETKQAMIQNSFDLEIALQAQQSFAAFSEAMAIQIEPGQPKTVTFENPMNHEVYAVTLCCQEKEIKTEKGILWVYPFQQSASPKLSETEKLLFVFDDEETVQDIVGVIVFEEPGTPDLVAGPYIQKKNVINVFIPGILVKENKNYKIIYRKD